MLMANDTETYKQQVGEAAANLVEDGMLVGLGTGTTATFLVKALAARLQNGLHIRGAVPSSEATARLAKSLHIPLLPLGAYGELDLAIDGADEIDPQLNLIKGGGGALLREKIVASAARRFVVIGDASKLVPRLGTAFALPVEVVPFAQVVVMGKLKALGANIMMRTLKGSGDLFVTDNGNYIIDCRFPGGIADPEKLQTQIRAIVGVVEHGLFLHMAERALIAGPNGLLTLP
jgi:ribose 5-phosphate isomerase A